MKKRRGMGGTEGSIPSAFKKGTYQNPKPKVPKKVKKKRPHGVDTVGYQERAFPETTTLKVWSNTRKGGGGGNVCNRERTDTGLTPYIDLRKKKTTIK